MERITIAGLAAVHTKPTGPPSSSTPILFVHGAWGGKSQFEKWQQFAADQGFESYALDLPCHFESGCSGELGSITVEDYAQAVERVTAQIGPCSIVGHSLGGLIGQVIAARNPNVARLVLAATTPPAGITFLNRAALAMLKYIPAIVTKKEVLISRKDALRYYLWRLGADAYAAFVPDSGAAMGDVLFGKVKVKAIEKPVLVLVGEKDKTLPMAIEKRIAKKYDASFISISNMGHYLMLEEGWEWPIEKIIAWLRS